MKTLRFAALSLMLLLSAGAFAQITRITNGDTLIIEFGIDTSQPKDCNLYLGETNCNHLRVDGNGNGSVTCFMGFKSITVNKGTVANEYVYTTDSVEIIVNRDAKFYNNKNISYGEITVNQNAEFYNDANISYGEITINGENISLSFENSKDILSGKITVNGGSFENLSSADIGADVSVTAGAFFNGSTVSGNIELSGGEFVNQNPYPSVIAVKSDSILLTGGKFANYTTIESSTTITVKGGQFKNFKQDENNDGGLTANIIVDGGRFENGFNSNSTVYTVTGVITVKSGEFHNWGIVNPWFDNIKLHGGEFVNEPNGKITPDNNNIFIDGGTFTNKGNITSSRSKGISIFGGQFVNNKTITGLSFLLYVGKLTNNDTITTQYINICDSAIVTNYGTID